MGDFKVALNYSKIHIDIYDLQLYIKRIWLGKIKYFG